MFHQLNQLIPGFDISSDNIPKGNYIRNYIKWFRPQNIGWR